LIAAEQILVTEIVRTEMILDDIAEKIQIPDSEKVHMQNLRDTARDKSKEVRNVVIT
jgi:hypothetical protein